MAVALPCDKGSEVAKFDTPQIKRFAQRLFVMSCHPPACPLWTWMVDAANIQLFSQIMNLYLIFPANQLTPFRSFCTFSQDNFVPFFWGKTQIAMDYP